MKHQVFISYRRADSALAAQFLHRELANKLGGERVFFDRGIDPGADYVETLTTAAGNCDVLIAVIGPDWLHIQDDSGTRRLDKPDDWVRKEISTALNRGVTVIPVTLRGASPPDPSKLPDDLAALANRQALPLRDDDLEAGLSRLIRLIQKELGISTQSASQKEREIEGLSKDARMIKADADQMFLDVLRDSTPPEYGPDGRAEVDLDDMLEGFDEAGHVRKLEEAEELIKKALTLDETNAEALLLLAELLIELTPDDPDDERELLYKVQNLIPSPKDDSERFHLAKATFLLAQLGDHIHEESLRDARDVFERLGRREWVRQCDDILAGASRQTVQDHVQDASRSGVFNPTGSWRINDSAAFPSQFFVSFLPDGTFNGQQQTPALGVSAGVHGQWAYDAGNSVLHIQGYANGVMPMGVSIFLQGQNGNGWYGLGNDGVAYMLSPAA